MKNHREMRKEDLKEGCGGIFREKPKEKLSKRERRGNGERG